MSGSASTMYSNIIDADDPIIDTINTMFLMTGSYEMFKTNTFIKYIAYKGLFDNTTVKSKYSAKAITPDDVANIIQCVNTKVSTFSGNDKNPLSTFEAEKCTLTSTSIMNFLDTKFVQAKGDEIFSLNCPTDADITTYPPQKDYIGSVPEVKEGDDGIDKHRSFVKRILAYIFQKQCEKYQKTTFVTCSLQDSGDTSPRTWCSSLCTQIFKSVSTQYKFDIFYKDIITRYDELFLNRPGATIEQKNLFLVLMFPYFVFEYMIQCVGHVQQLVPDKAPRNFLLRRNAIAYCYMYEYFLIKFIKAYSPDGSTCFSSLDAATVVRNAMLMEDSEQESDIALLRNQTLNNVNMSRQINDISQDIRLGRNNLNKVVVNDVGIIKKTKLAMAYMIVWCVLFGIFAVSAPILILLYKGNTSNSSGFRGNLLTILYIMSGILLFALLISGIVQVAKNF